MLRKGIVGALSFFLGLQCITLPALAYQREFRLPILGHQRHAAASGNARHITVRQQVGVRDHEQLIINIRNVPLSPGTVLVVNVHNEAIGNITLDSRRSGTLKLTSEKSFIPELNWGSSVTITKIDGTLVAW